MVVAVTKYTFIFSIALIILGIVGYYKTDRASVTALIPTFFGIAMLICAFLSLVPGKIHKHSMHVTAMLALFGFIGSVSGIPDAVRVMLDIEVARPEAAVCKAIMALICAVYIIIAVRWFINNRRSKIPPIIA